MQNWDVRLEVSEIAEPIVRKLNVGIFEHGGFGGCPLCLLMLSFVKFGSRFHLLAISTALKPNSILLANRLASWLASWSATCQRADNVMEFGLYRV